MFFNKPIGPLFRGTKHLEGQIDEFLDCIADAGQLFQRVIKEYLHEGAGEAFEQAVQKVHLYESRADKLRPQYRIGFVRTNLDPGFACGCAEPA